jgi:predicted enzyme related to lactoylglutathione lyase
VGNLSLAIGVFGEVKPGGASAALAVDSVKKAVAELKKKKVKILQEPMESDPCFMAVIEDPDGNQIIIHERKDGTVG